MVIPQQPPEFWQHSPLRVALAGRHIGKVIREYRLHPAHGRNVLSQERMGDFLGLTQPQLSRVENDPPVIHLDKLIHWALILSIPAEYLWFTLPTNDADRKATLERLPISTRVILPTQYTGPTEETLERDISAMVRRSVAFAKATQAAALGSDAIDQLHDDISHLASQFLTMSVLDIIGELAEFQDAIFTAIDSHHRTIPESRELYFAGAIVTGLLAHSMKDLGRMYEATTFARTVYVCAQAADHKPLMAWARGEISLIAYRQGDFDRALSSAESAAYISRNLSGSTAIWSHALRARALARLNNHEEARQALNSVQRAREAYVPDELDRIGGLFIFTPPKESYYVAGALADAADTAREAETQALDALAHYSDSTTNYATEAGIRCELALARSQAGQFEGVSDALDPLFELPPVRRISGILDSLERVRASLIAIPGESVLASEIARDIQDFRRFPAGTLTE